MDQGELLYNRASCLYKKKKEHMDTETKDEAR